MRRHGNIRSDEAGNTALYALLLLPVALLFSSLVVDVSGWNALRDKLQQEADRLAFQGAGGLPQESVARARIESAAQDLIHSGVQAAVFFPTAEHSAVGVTLQSQYKSSFDFLLRPLLRAAFQVTRSGVAQVIPGDYVLVVADGGTLRPRLLPNASGYKFPAWGSELEWPASRYFECVTPPVISEPNELNWAWWNDWSKPDFQRWATQSCYNPVLTPLKRAAIGLSESLLRYNVNRLAVLFTPGNADSLGFQTARHIHGEAELSTIYPGQIGGFVPSSGRIAAAWGNYLELERFLGDEVCMMLSQPAASLSTNYEFPPTSFTNGCEEPLASPPCGGRHYSSGHFADCYLSDAISVRDAIYWHAAKLPLPSFPAKPNIVASLKQGWSELTDDRAYAAELPIRGNLAQNALRQVYVLTDYLPPVDAELTNLLLDYQSHRIEIVAVPFFHEGLTPAESAGLQLNTDAWARLSKQYSRTLRIAPASSPSELETKTVPRLLSNALQFALRS